MSTADKLSVGICQLDMLWENKKLNRNKIIDILHAYSKPIDCIVFPEMTLTGFSMNPNATCLTKDDFNFFAELARQKKSYFIFGGVEELQNKMFVMSPSGEKTFSYSKKHLFSYSDENIYYKPGSENSSFNLFDWNVTPGICYDLRFAYHFWERALTNEIIIVVASWPASRSAHWKTLLSARAIENQSYVVAVNRTGSDPSNSYSGDSMIINPFGEILIHASLEEGLFVGELSKSLVAECRNKYPFIKDRCNNLQFF